MILQIAGGTEPTEYVGAARPKFTYDVRDKRLGFCETKNRLHNRYEYCISRERHQPNVPRPAGVEAKPRTNLRWLTKPTPTESSYLPIAQASIKDGVPVTLRHSAFFWDTRPIISALSKEYTLGELRETRTVRIPQFNQTIFIAPVMNSYRFLFLDALGLLQNQ